MKLENQQSTITNIQFSGGRPIGGNLGNTSYAKATINFSGITTGSTEQAKAAATITNFGNGTFCILSGSANGKIFLTSSGQVDAPPFYYVPTGSTSAITVANIANEINTYSNTFGIIALATGSVLQLTSSFYGVGSNGLNFVSASVTTTLAGGLTLTTGSFSLTDTFGVKSVYIITSSTQAVANLNATQSVNGNTYFVSGGQTQAGTVSNIAAFLNASSSAIVQATGSTTNLQLTSSINGVAGNNVYVVSGSTTTYLTGATGPSDYPWSFPFIAGGLYVAVPGTVAVTTIDGSQISFVSASGFIPGLFQAVSSSSTALSIVALK